MKRGSSSRHSGVSAAGVAPLVLCLLSTAILCAAEETFPEPPNAVPDVVVTEPGDGTSGLKLCATYAGRTLFNGSIKIRTPLGDFDPEAPAIRLLDLRVSYSTGKMSRPGDKLDRTVLFQLVGNVPACDLVLAGTCYASPEAFAAETRGEAQERFPLIRSSVGPSRNLRNNAIYDRRFDWVLEGPSDGSMRIWPAAETAEGRTFAFEATGKTISLTFWPRFFQKHRNLPFFEPWTYRVWPKSVAGWCSWWPYRSEISEKIVKEVAALFGEKLREFGYEYIQIDDGFQRSMGGMPEDWLNTNDRFPGGLASLAAAIRDQGLTPGLWLSTHFGDENLAAAHPDWFARGSDGKPFKGRWIDFGLDGSSDAALDAVVRPLYRELQRQGWGYVKIDTLRHLLYDAYYPCREHFAADGGATGSGGEGAPGRLEHAFRNILAAAREEIGRDTYMLACWGVLPEAIGVADGCRLGWDGFGPTTLVQYNSFNNVVWRDDPDHVDITPEGEEIIRPVLVSMAGAMMMLTDKVEVYRDDAKIEGARRSAPVPFTLPGQLYDFDPTKTDNLAAGLRNDQGGAKPGPIDADQHGAFCPWWLVEVNQPFESWFVLARLSWEALPAAEVRFADLGLPPDNEYLVYEFWGKEFLGAFEGSFTAPPQQPREARVFAIRTRLDRPQIVSTSRHILQGWPDLADVHWDERALCLRGQSDVVAGDAYDLLIHVPKDMTLVRAEVNGNGTVWGREENLCRVQAVSDRTTRIEWVVALRE